MAPGGEMLRYPQHFGENVLRHGSHEWLPYSNNEVRLKSSNTNLPFCFLLRKTAPLLSWSGAVGMGRLFPREGMFLGGQTGEVVQTHIAHCQFCKPFKRNGASENRGLQRRLGCYFTVLVRHFWVAVSA